MTMGVGLRNLGIVPLHSMATGALGAWWDPRQEGLCVWAAYRPRGAASFAASLADLSGNGNDASDPGGANTPAWDAVNGWGFTAANSHYLTTAFFPQNDQSQSVLAQFTNAANPDGRILGVDNAGVGDEFGLRPRTAGVNHDYINGGQASVAGALVNGNMAIAGGQGYLNGVVDGGAIGGWGGAAAVLPVYIGCSDNNGVAGSFQTVQIRALVFYNCALTAPQIAAIAAAMVAL